MAISRYYLSAKYPVVKINPVRIRSKYKICLPVSRPAFDLLFSLDCRFYIACFFKIHQFMHSVFCSEAIGVCVIFMFIYPTDQISCHAGIQYRMIFICQDIHIVMHASILLHFTRRLPRPFGPRNDMVIVTLLCLNYVAFSDFDGLAQFGKPARLAAGDEHLAGDDLV